jgi:hypothetical protein
VNLVRAQLSIRALRRRRRWRQLDLPAAVGLPVGRVRLAEGHMSQLRVGEMDAVAGALGATADVQVRWHGEGVDRLLDAGHAAVVEATVRRLQADGWETRTEVTFNFDGERGSVDVSARHLPEHALVVVECRSVVLPGAAVAARGPLRAPRSRPLRRAAAVAASRPAVVTQLTGAARARPTGTRACPPQVRLPRPP